jgi:hypothetical protein
VQLTIHSYCELPNVATRIIEAYAEVRLKDIEGVAPLLEDALEKLGFIVAATNFSLETQQVDIYISKLDDEVLS